MGRYSAVILGFGRIAYGLSANQAYQSYYRHGTHYQAMQLDGAFEPVAVVDPSAEARALAGQLGIGIAVADVADLPGDRQFDVAVFCGPPRGRLDSLSRLPGVRGVIFEKPLAESAEEAEALADECRGRKLTVQVGYMRRSDSRFRRLAAGYLAELVGKPRAGYALYGNGLRNNAAHIVNLVEFLAGPIVEVRAIGAPAATAQSPVPGDCNVAFMVTAASGANICFDALDFGRVRELSLEFWGDGGSLTINSELTEFHHRGLAPHRLLPSSNGYGDPVRVFPAESDAFPMMYRSFAKALAGEGAVDCGPDEALKTESILDAVVASAAQGGRVVRLA